MIMKALLLAGGHGTRLRPLTFTGNKHMLPIANKPMILYSLGYLIDAGIREIGVVLGPINEDVKSLLGDGSKFGVNITYIEQPEPKGLAHAVMISEDFLDEHFVMCLGDNLLSQGAKPFVEQFQKSNPNCVIGVARVRDPSMYGNVIVDEAGHVKKLVEKPKDSKSNLALIGVYVFDSKIFEAVKKIKPSFRGELEITDAIQTLLEDGAKVDLQRVSGWWKDTGKPEDLLEANQLVLQELHHKIEGAIDEGAKVLGGVSIGKESKILGNCTLRGPIVIGERCEIGPAAHIGPYTSIGNDVTIRNCEIENSIVMDGVFADCRKRILDSMIGTRSRIVGSEYGIERGLKLVLGDSTYVGV